MSNKKSPVANGIDKLSPSTNIRDLKDPAQHYLREVIKTRNAIVGDLVVYVVRLRMQTIGIGPTEEAAIADAKVRSPRAYRDLISMHGESVLQPRGTMMVI